MPDADETFVTFPEKNSSEGGKERSVALCLKEDGAACR